MADYKTPGVYVEEISTLPPSVAQVATAVPAFIGNTEKQPDDNAPKKITSLLEYQEIFGGPYLKKYSLQATEDPVLKGTYTFKDLTAADTKDKCIMYYAIKLYFSNGGGPCYVHSVGSYGENGTIADKGKYGDMSTAGIAKVNTLDEPTILVLPDAALTLKPTEYYPLAGGLIDACEAKKDRFAVLDVPKTTAGYDSAAFRTGVGSKDLSYGAAYMPYLKSAIAYEYKEEEVTVTTVPPPPPPPPYTITLDGALTITFNEKGGANHPNVNVDATKPSSGKPIFEISNNALTIHGKKSGSGVNIVMLTAQEVVNAWDSFNNSEKNNWKLEVISSKESTNISTTSGSSQLQPVPPANGPGTALSTLKTGDNANTALYNAAKAYLNNMPKVVLPPSGAIAGLYCQVDNDRGVWKAPANVAVSNVLGPDHFISDTDQQNLNVDPNSGKSINAIRSFSGKGTLVWGARTLDGNSNEWRYIPVRRLFITIEESVQKASAFAVFEPNDITTWLKVKAMIESYLYGLWQQGAMMGASPDEAYFVHVGLNQTMTQQDILEGRMIVQVGIAAVRPAEFIILRFQHYMQES